MSFVAGKYAVTYDGDSLGQIEQGITLEHQFFGQVITGDCLAEGAQDMVFRGTSVFAQMTLLEWDAEASASALWPWGASYLDQNVVVGNLASARWKSLVMTALTDTPAATKGPSTITLHSTLLAENYPVSVLFAPALRTVPLRFRVFPKGEGVSSGTALYGTTT